MRKEYLPQAGSCTYVKMDGHHAVIEPGGLVEQGLLFLLKGSAICENGKLSATVRPGDVLIFGRSRVVLSRAEYFLIHGVPDAQLLNAAQNLVLQVSREHFSRMVALLTQLDYYSGSDPESSDLVMKLLLHELSKWSGEVQMQAAGEDKLQRPLAWIEQNYRRNFTLKEISSELGYEPSYFCRMFHKHAGLTPGEYQCKLRLKDACILLTETDHTVCAIAESLGFSSDKHFMSVFKKHMHITPTQYRSAFSGAD